MFKTLQTFNIIKDALGNFRKNIEISVSYDNLNS